MGSSKNPEKKSMSLKKKMKRLFSTLMIMRNVFFVQQISTLEWFLSNDAENFNLDHRNELHFKIENTIFQLKVENFSTCQLTLPFKSW